MVESTHFVTVQSLCAHRQVSLTIWTGNASLTYIHAVDLSAVYSVATKVSDYAHLPTLGHSLYLTHLSCDLNIRKDSGSLPSTGASLAAFLSDAEEVLLPYFEGYAGEHQLDHPGYMELVRAPLPGTSIYIIHLDSLAELLSI